MNKCNHDWWYLRSGFTEGCADAICIKCEEIGCFCDVKRQNPNADISDFMKRTVPNSKSISDRYMSDDIYGYVNKRYANFNLDRVDE